MYFLLAIAAMLFVGVVVLVISLGILDDRKQKDRRRRRAQARRQQEIQAAKEREIYAAREHAERERKFRETADAVLHEKLIVLNVATPYLNQVEREWGVISEPLISVAVTWDKINEIRIWYEKDAGNLIVELRKFSQILTSKGDRFDLRVLERYGSVKDLKRKSVDVLSFIKRHTGKRISLDSLAKESLHVDRTMTAIEAVNLWRSGDQGNRKRFVDFCKKDVEILRDLYVFLHAFGLSFPGPNFRTVHIRADGSHEYVS